MTNDDTDSPSRPTDAQSSRRRFLRTTALGGILGLAGCLSTDSGTEDDAPTATMDAIKQVEFAGEHLVLTATEAFRGTELHVVDPTETVWAKTRTEHTTGKARIQLLDVDGVGEDNHYTPGMFEFVFEPRAEEPHTERLRIAPKISVVAATQQEESDSGSAGQIDVQVLNEGTGPTWVTQITYEKSPNSAANSDLVESDFPQLSGLNAPSDAIIYPGDVREFTSLSFPLKFRAEDDDQCDQRELIMELVVKTPASDPLREEIQAIVGGEPISSGLTGDYLCSSVQIDLIQGDDE